MAHSFEIKSDEELDPDCLFIRANLSEILTVEESGAFKGSLIAWSEEDCQGTIYLDEEIEWYEGPEGIWIEFYTDLLRLGEGLQNALELLWKRFDAFPKIISVMIHDWQR